MTDNESTSSFVNPKPKNVHRIEPWIALALCAAVLLGWAIKSLVQNQPTYAEDFAPAWLPLLAAVVSAAGIIPLGGGPRWIRLQQVLHWIGLLLMVWVANGLPVDLLRIIGLIPLEVDWLGMALRILALAAAVVLAHLALARPVVSESSRPAAWYGYAALVLALPYPVMRTIWVLGGTVGLMSPGAAGIGFTPWLASVPWILAAALSLLLVLTPRWMPRRLLLIAGWFATAVVAMVGPGFVWGLVNQLAAGTADSGDIAIWVPCLFYGSWFLWAIAAAAATRSYQLRSAAVRVSPSQ
jgi:hypothetical protein